MPVNGKMRFYYDLLEYKAISWLLMEDIIKIEKMKFHLRTKDDDKTLKKLIMDFSKL